MVETAIADTLRDLDALGPDELVEDRYKRFRRMGAYLA